MLSKSSREAGLPSAALCGGRTVFTVLRLCVTFLCVALLCVANLCVTNLCAAYLYERLHPIPISIIGRIYLR